MYLRNAIKNIPYRNLRIVTGFVNDKNIEKIVSLLPDDAYYYLTQAKIPRAKSAKELAEIFSSQNKRVYKIIDDVKKALDSALADATTDDLVIVTGSAFVVAEVV
jgi:dihydrofolate synthase/folylpolyglutamate synthase